MTIKVLVVDDSIVARKMLSSAIGADAELEVVGTASNGKIALERIAEVDPDVVTLDIEMPEMDGITTLGHIRETDKERVVIMVSSVTRAGATTTIDALAEGADDYVAKPTGAGSPREALEMVAAELLPMIKLFGRKRVGTTGSGPSEPPTSITGARDGPTRVPCTQDGAVDAVLVGSSTGGPVALETMLSAIDPPLSIPALVVQHMPPKFTASLAERLDRQCASRVVEGAHGMLLEPGTVYIAPGGSHMEVRGNALTARLLTHDGPLVNSCRPAVDVLFESARRVYGGNLLGVVLTGMGYDGRSSSAALKAAGANIIAQDEATSVVWGMPGAVAEDGTACRVLPIEEIGASVARRVRREAGLDRATP